MVCKLVYKDAGKNYDVNTGEVLELTHNVPMVDKSFFFLIGKTKNGKFWWRKVKPLVLMNLSPELKQLIGKE